MALKLIPVEEELMTAGGNEVTYLTKGVGETILYLHSETVGYRWLPFLDDLSECFRVIMPVHPGFFPSNSISSFDTIADFAFHYIEFIERLQEHPLAAIVGSSVGGWIALELLSWVPNVARRLVLASPLGIRTEANYPEIFGISWSEMAGRIWSDAQVDYIREYSTAATNPIEHYRNMSMLALIGWKPYLHDPKLVHRLRRIRSDTLIVWGVRDTLTPASHARTLERAITGNVALELVTDAGHDPLCHPRSKAQDVLLGFLGV